MPPPLSREVRDQIQDHFLRLDETAFIREATGVSISQISKMRRCWEETGLVVPSHGRPGPPTLITPRMAEDLLEWLEQRPLSYLDEIARFLKDEYDVVVSIQTISRFLGRVGWTRKKVDLSYGI